MRNFKERDWTEEEKYLSLEHRSVDWKTKRWKSKWIVVNKQNKEIDEINFDHRIYNLQELREMLKKESLETTHIYGSFKKKDFDETMSKRIVILSIKKGK